MKKVRQSEEGEIFDYSLDPESASKFCYEEVQAEGYPFSYYSVCCRIIKHLAELKSNGWFEMFTDSDQTIESVVDSQIQWNELSQEEVFELIQTNSYYFKQLGYNDETLSNLISSIPINYIKTSVQQFINQE